MAIAGYGNLYETEIIRIDPRSEQVIVEEVKQPLMNNINVEVKPQQAQYRFDCMEGAAHPLNIEVAHYKLVMICTESIDSTVQFQGSIKGRQPRSSFNEVEMGFIGSVKRRPEIEWAIDNSFDGLYVHRVEDPTRFRTRFKFAVYMKEEKAIFWKLKYSGR